MAEQGYPGAGEHVRAHRALVERVARARADDSPGAEARLAEAAASIAQVVEEHMRSDELLVYSTDYPHWQFDGQDVMPEGFSAELIRKITIDNPLQAFPRLGLAQGGETPTNKELAS